MAYWLEGVPVRPDVQPTTRTANLRLSHLNSSRARRHYAFFVTVAIVGILTFVVFPARRLALTANGGVVLAVSRNSDSMALLQAAGVQASPGDVVVRAGNDLRLERAAPIVVEADGRVMGWWTRAASIDALLKELDIQVGQYDTVTLDGEAVSPQTGVPFVLSATAGDNASAFAKAPAVGIRRAVPLTILEDGKPISVQSSRFTLDQVLSDAGIVLDDADQVSMPLATEPVAGLTLEVKHAREVTLRVGSSSFTVKTQKRTVGEVLAEAGYEIGPDDRVEPAVSALVANGTVARLVRVSGRQVIEKEPIKHKTVFKPDEDLTGSATRTVQGHDGLLQREYRIVIEDGIEKEKRLVREYQEPEVADTVIYYAASTLRAAGVPLGTFKVDRSEHVYATWYNAASSGKDPTDPTYGITASGVPVIKGVVAVDPAVIPLGTRLYVPGYGFAVAGDTGGGIRGQIIDLGYPDGVAVDWRTGWVDIYVLAP